jgi:two-component system chemotaxis response regulator CheB
MPLKRKIKVLVIDDSLIFRETIASILADDPDLEVVGAAADVYAGSRLIEMVEPDVLTLDVELPRMNGIEFLRRLLPQHPLPVVVVSSIADNVFDALREGAVDFVTKPAPGQPGGLEQMARELIIKVKIASTARVRQPAPRVTSRPMARPLNRQSSATGPNPSGNGRGFKISWPADTSRPVDLIVMGASTGGTEAVSQILSQFPENMPPILVVQHMLPLFTQLYAQRLDRGCRLSVREAADGDALQPGVVLLAAGDHHLSVRRDGRQLVAVSRNGERVNGHCPSVDVLFESVSKLGPLNVIGILLTGMGYDGARGMLALKKSGALTIGQDEESCVVYGMPKVAFDLGAVQCQAPLEQIASIVLNRLECSSRI